MATLSASIMAHPCREKHVDRLLGQLDREVPVSWDINTPPSPAKPRRWKVGRYAWEMATGDWHIVMQDDITVCRDFLAGLERSLAHVPADIGIVQPFIGTSRALGQHMVSLAREAEKIHASWISHRSMCWGVAICVRTATVPEMLRWCDARQTLAYDTRVGRYYRDVLGQRTYYTNPPLVNHLALPSLVGHGSNRVGYSPFKGSALELKWDGPVQQDHVPIQRNQAKPKAKPRGPRPIVRNR